MAGHHVNVGRADGPSWGAAWRKLRWLRRRLPLLRGFRLRLRLLWVVGLQLLQLVVMLLGVRLACRSARGVETLGLRGRGRQAPEVDHVVHRRGAELQPFCMGSLLALPKPRLLNTQERLLPSTPIGHPCAPKPQSESRASITARASKSRGSWGWSKGLPAFSTMTAQGTVCPWPRFIQLCSAVGSHGPTTSSSARIESDTT